MKAIIMKSKRYLYQTKKNQIFKICLELNVLLIKAFELPKNTCQKKQCIKKKDIKQVCAPVACNEMVDLGG